ncbi:MAG: hypothetical protein ABFS32_11560 [Bacteroidota bacterium]
MKKIFLVAIIFFFVGALGCEEPEHNGKVIFYTNAQAVLNCGSFDVEIYIDDELVGVLEEPRLPLDDNKPECDSEDDNTLVVLELPEGEYEYTARLTCSSTLKYLGDFEVNLEGCTLEYIDLTYTD